MECIDVGSHLWVSDDHTHPAGVEIGCRMAFSKVVAGRVGRKEGARQPNSGQVRLVDIAFHARNTVFEKVGDQGLTVGCPPLKGTPSRRNGGIGD